MKKLYVFIIGLVIGIFCNPFFFTWVYLNTLPESNNDILQQDLSLEKESAEYILSIVSSVDQIRFFIYNNSVSNPIVRYDNTSDILIKLVEAHKTEKKLPLLCGYRAMAMERILYYMEVESRMVSIYSDEFDDVRGHMFLEVLNSETGLWEVQDPYFDVYYIDNHGERVSTLQLVFGDLSRITPVSTKTRGWEQTNNTLLRDKFFESVLYFNEQRHVVLINTDRFNITKKFFENNNMTIIDVVKVYCNDPVVIMNQEW